MPTKRTSARGRHRAPSNTTRTLTLGAVTGGTIAVGVIAPSAAHAATQSQWERVAACESSDNWAADTGNGYYGGLQFAASTWDSFGGERYAPLANEASEAAQIDVADRVLAAQGWNAWPVCSREAGVADTPTTDTEVYRSSWSGGSHSDAAKKPAHHSATKAAHFGTQIKPATYTVKSGDDLYSIALRHHVKGGWQGLWRDNRKTIGANPDDIHVGMKLRLRELTAAERAGSRTDGIYAAR